MDKEIWKDIIGYEGLYQVSNLGRIKSLNFNHTKKEKIINPRTGNRYYMIALYKNGVRKDCLLHRIVAENFIENKESKPYVNHKDENCFNNNVNNLMWCTHKENMNWGTRNIRISIKNTNNRKKCKKINQYDLQGNFIKTWDSIKEACENLNINPSHVSSCCRKKYGRKTIGGYIWKYAEKN